MTQAALIVVDLQNDYFSGGRCELVGIDLAARNAATLIAYYRQKNLPVFFIRHEFPTADAPFFAPGSEGAQIHPSVAPAEGEAIVMKCQINAFKETDLKQQLDEQDIGNLAICGAMSHMCIDGITRAASDLGYDCTVVHDACATLPVEFNGVEVPAEQVHAAFMAALKFAYAEVVGTAELTAAVAS